MSYRVLLRVFFALDFSSCRPISLRLVTMPRYFSREQAEKLLPEVEVTIRRAIELKQQYQRLEAEWERFSQRIQMAGGARVNHSAALEMKGSKDEAARDLKRCVQKIHDFGCLVKDLDTGLIDFPTLFQEREVYLCWKLGEQGIQFWHAVEEGFRGRKPIDAEFLAQHRGEGAA